MYYNRSSICYRHKRKWCYSNYNHHQQLIIILQSQQDPFHPRRTPSLRACCYKILLLLVVAVLTIAPSCFATAVTITGTTTQMIMIQPSSLRISKRIPFVVVNNNNNKILSHYHRPRRTTNWTDPTKTLFQVLRGGGGGGDDDDDVKVDDSAATKVDESDDADSSLSSTNNLDVTNMTTTSQSCAIDKTYYIQQQLYLQSRSLQLRQALIQRGLHTLSHTTSSSSGTTTMNKKGTSSSTIQKVVDWECALSTEEYPKSCLYSLDAEYGQKVIAPMLPVDDDDDEMDVNDSSKTQKKNVKKYEWITISSLNRLYRTDPNKVEPLWYNQYTILSTWFSRNNALSSHPYSIYTHISSNIYATMITTALNIQPQWLLSVLFMSTVVTVVGIIFLPFIESSITLFMTSSVLWMNWPTWSRFTTHAALPVQLLIVQILFGLLQQGIQSLTQYIRTMLIDEECRLLQHCIPLTIIEGRSSGNIDTSDIVDEEDEGNDNVDDDEEV